MKVDPKEFGRSIHDFLAHHVLDHDPEKVNGAIIVVSNITNDKTGECHVCMGGGGDPDVLSDLMIGTIDSIVNSNAEVKELFMKKLKMKLLAETMESIVDELSSAFEKKAVQEDKPSAEVLGSLIQRLKEGKEGKHGEV